MNRRSDPSVRNLQLDVTGSDRAPVLVFSHDCGATARIPAGAPTDVPGGVVANIQLSGARLSSLSEARRRRILRECRHLLAPGGRLAVPVGSHTDQYPRDDLQRASWSCGFEAYVRFVAGRAVLTRPARDSEDDPLVSILIPAYKSADFIAALDSALAQTWSRCEIVVADDSADGVIAGLVDTRRDRVRDGHELRYIRHKENMGGRANYLGLFTEARGEYIKFLNDDDLLAPTCAERMVDVLTAHPGVTLVTSYRRLIGAAGEHLPDEACNEPLLPADGIIDGRHLAGRVFRLMTNVVGEPTTTMFRRTDLADNRPHLMSYAGRPARRNGDIAMWTALMSRGDVAWLAEPLSSFRQHPGQFQRGEEFQREAGQAWQELFLDARETGLIGESPSATDLPAAMLTEIIPDPAADVSVAESAWREGKPQDATARLRSLLAACPDHRRARSDLACMDWMAGRGEVAVLGALLALGDEAHAVERTTLLNLRDMLNGLERPEEAQAVAGACTAVGA